MCSVNVKCTISNIIEGEAFIIVYRIARKSSRGSNLRIGNLLIFHGSNFADACNCDKYTNALISQFMTQL